MKITLLAFAVVVSLFFVKTVAAQDSVAVDTNQYFEPVPTAPSDTSIYDMGRVSLQKKYTQAITIKAADLEKMPFYDLQDALYSYYNGLYGSKQKFSYVIDGVLNTDVNAYSIYDIDEVTFVQNAANAINGVLPTGVLVLIKTKRGGAGKSGIMVNGQTNAIKRLIPSTAIDPANSTNRSGPSPVALYHQYYISAYKNTGFINAGLSASVQHNNFPQYHNNLVNTKFKDLGGNRFKVNGYLDVKLDDNNSISLNAGFVPQRDNEAYKKNSTYMGQPVEGGSNKFTSQNLWYAGIQFKSVIAQRISNKLSASYQRRDLVSQFLGIYPNNNSRQFSFDTTSTVNSFVVKDDISYQFQIGDFVLNPAINVTYRQSKDSSFFGRVFSPSSARALRGAKIFQKSFIVTPSLTVNFANIAALQVGAQKATYNAINFGRATGNQAGDGQPVNFTPTGGAEFNNSTATPVLPFASLGVNVWQILGVPDSAMALSVNVSYAKSTSFADDMYGTINAYIFNRTSDRRAPIFDPYDPGQTFNQIQGGVDLSLAKNMLSFSYNYSQSKFRAVYYFQGQVGLPAYDTARLTNGRVDIHRLGINFNLPGKQKLKWTANLNGNIIMNRGPKENYALEQLRQFYNNQSIITGGFANQLKFGDLFAGFNVVYAINRAIRVQTPITNDYLFPSFDKGPNLFNLQNVYVGYQLKLFNNTKRLEVFVNARNLMQTGVASSRSVQYAFDENKYYGGGFKLAL